MRALLGMLILTVGCSDQVLIGEPPPPVASPPEEREDGTGNPPDFNTCTPAYFAQYFNLEADHPDVIREPSPDYEADGAAGLAADWWDLDRLAFQQTDPGLAFGEAWWPVDEGLSGDPAWFAVRWNAWLRASSDTDWTFALGARDDAWVLVDGEVVAQIEPLRSFEISEYEVDVEGGRHVLEIRFAHRLGDADGFFFRSLGGDLEVCPPIFD
jgi:hypothetical protein